MEMDFLRRKALQALEERLGYTFADLSLLDAALTHTSYVKGDGKAHEHNERLEFLGDAVLELCVSEYLYRNFPKLNEGSAVTSAHTERQVGSHRPAKSPGEGRPEDDQGRRSSGKSIHRGSGKYQRQNAGNRRWQRKTPVLSAPISPGGFGESGISGCHSPLQRRGGQAGRCQREYPEATAQGAAAGL